jgi:hypothetical protein
MGRIYQSPEKQYEELLESNYGKLVSMNGREISFSDGVKNMIKLTSKHLFFPRVIHRYCTRD